VIIDNSVTIEKLRRKAGIMEGFHECLKEYYNYVFIENRDKILPIIFQSEMEENYLRKVLAQTFAKLGNDHLNCLSHLIAKYHKTSNLLNEEIQNESIVQGNNIYKILMEKKSNK